MSAEIYVSTDVEADGPIPGPHSMLSFASAAFAAEGELVSTFTMNLLPLDGAVADPRTAQFWASNPEAWAATQVDREPPSEAMHEYVTWLDVLPGLPVFVGYPVTYDFMWVYWYLIRFVGRSPFSHSGADMKTLAWTLIDKGYRGATKRHWPQEWFSPDVAHTHVALDDAIGQGLSFLRMQTEARRRLGPRH